MALQINLGIAVQQIRKGLGISQEQLAIQADIDRRYMSDIENGKRNVSLDILERIASSLNINVSTLLERAETVGQAPMTVDKLKDWLCENDYENTVVLENPDYLSAIVGVTEDGRMAYSYDKMVEHLVMHENMDAEEAMEFIDYNTLRALPYAGEKSPVVLFNIDA